MEDLERNRRYVQIHRGAGKSNARNIAIESAMLRVKAAVESGLIDGSQYEIVNMLSELLKDTRLQVSFAGDGGISIGWVDEYPLDAFAPETESGWGEERMQTLKDQQPWKERKNVLRRNVRTKAKRRRK